MPPHTCPARTNLVRLTLDLPWVYGLADQRAASDATDTSRPPDLSHHFVPAALPTTTECLRCGSRTDELLPGLRRPGCSMPQTYGISPTQAAAMATAAASGQFTLSTKIPWPVKWPRGREGRRAWPAGVPMKQDRNPRSPPQMPGQMPPMGSGVPMAPNTQMAQRRMSHVGSPGVQSAQPVLNHISRASVAPPGAPPQAMAQGQPISGDGGQQQPGRVAALRQREAVSPDPEAPRCATEAGRAAASHLEGSQALLARVTTQSCHAPTPWSWRPLPHC